MKDCWKCSPTRQPCWTFSHCWSWAVMKPLSAHTSSQSQTPTRLRFHFSGYLAFRWHCSRAKRLYKSNRSRKVAPAWECRTFLGYREESQALWGLYPNSHTTITQYNVLKKGRQREEYNKAQRKTHWLSVCVCPGFWKMSSSSPRTEVYLQEEVHRDKSSAVFVFSGLSAFSFLWGDQQKHSGSKRWDKRHF